MFESVSDCGADMQSMWINIDGRFEELQIPHDRAEVMPGVQWGMPENLFTPAFWKYQSEAQVRRRRYGNHRLGANLLEEISVCLLGGYGIPAEMGLLAFERLRDNGLLDGTASEDDLRAMLSSPFEGDGRSRKYRFANQKAKYLSRSLAEARQLNDLGGDKSSRDALLALPGIGPKTASWVIRNHYDSDEVAIIDIHLHRAGLLMNLFGKESDPAKDYFALEDAFLSFANAIAVRASVLDAVIWDYMRRIGPTAIRPRTAAVSPKAQLELVL
ncbi:hypothetical protein QTL95_21405 [Rhizobium sp. S152]|uniref:8-oxoguanine DNA glycosylase n=1 Tax=Rhizobium sp. S152 TaxID=3055038 RepID=UPI0025AA0EAD|nr:hypothetical protein [Rhizobium sp. S152]MDM9628457.1 hypothetical protein [Rhizobium sp. S152]